MEGVLLYARIFRLVLALLSLILAGNVQAEMTATIARIKPAVVIVGTYKSTNMPRFNLRGTGFVVSIGQSGTGNFVVTNAHVLPQAADLDAEAGLVVQMRGGLNELQMRPVSVIDVDKIHDLALLRFEGPAIPSVVVRDSDAVREGQAIAFIGFPIGGALGFSPVTHRGMISSIAPAALPTPSAQQLNAKTIRSLRAGDVFDIFQLDGTAYPGNSGGPLFDPDNGDVLGVVNMVFIKGTRESALTSPSGISYAIPSKFVLQLLQRQVAH